MGGNPVACSKFGALGFSPKIREITDHEKQFLVTLVSNILSKELFVNVGVFIVWHISRILEFSISTMLESPASIFLG